MEQFIEYFQSKGFMKVQVNVSGLHIFLTKQADADFAIVLFDMVSGNEWSKEQCANIEIQLRSKLQTENKLCILTFLCTNNVESVRDYYRDNDHTAVIDLHQHRLLIFEGLAIDELNIYKGMEEILEKQKENFLSLDSQYDNHELNPASKKANNSIFDRISNIFQQIGLVNSIIIALNIVIYLFLDFSGYYYEAVNAGSLFWYSVKEQHQYYRLFTSMFLHGGMEHLLNNMLILAVIGGILERMVGKLRYILLYVLSGTIAGLVSIGYNMEQMTIVRSIGASGAIFGVIGGVLLIVLVNKGKLADLSKKQMILFVIMSLYGGLSNQGVDNAAHFGGLIAGFILSILMYRRPKKKGMIS